MKKLSWTPIRTGKTYCAPACGGRCTHAAYVQTKRRAAVLCKKLGRGWKPEVWENLGWHFAATKGGLRVYGGQKISPRSRKTSWTAIWNCPENTGGSFGLSYSISAYTPRGAVRLILALMQVTRNTLNSTIAELEIR